MHHHAGYFLKFFVPVATTIVTLYTFTIWLSDGTWMICLLAALAMAGCTLTLLLTGGERREV